MRTVFTTSSPATLLDMPVDASLLWADFWVRSSFTEALRALADPDAPPLHRWPYIGRRVNLTAIGKEGTIKFQSNGGRNIDMFMLRILYDPKDAVTIFNLINDAVRPTGDAGFFLSLERS